MIFAIGWILMFIHAIGYRWIIEFGMYRRIPWWIEYYFIGGLMTGITLMVISIAIFVSRFMP
jgi:hypothetical protein